MRVVTISVNGLAQAVEKGFFEWLARQDADVVCVQDHRMRAYEVEDFNLIPVLTVFENIEYPLQMVQNWPKVKRTLRVQEMLKAVGMADQGHKFPSQISGGQKQRVAVARALVTNASLVLADEPTANLDRKTANHIIDLMKEMRNEFGTSFIFSTHDPKVVNSAEIVFTLEDGQLLQDESGENNV